MEKGKCSNCNREKAGYLCTLVRLFKIALLRRNTISKKETANIQMRMRQLRSSFIQVFSLLG